MAHTIWINSRSENAADVFAQNLRYLLNYVNPSRKPLAFACIGSANVTGDNLGPLIGTILTRSQLPCVYGTMEKPLNAITLPDCLLLLNSIADTHCLIAIDASLGSQKQSGHVTLTDTCLYPGAGVFRNLPAIGDLHITGVFDSLNTKKARQILPGLCQNIGWGLLDVCSIP